MNMIGSATKVCVIGGGLAGLTTACYLARANVEVTLFEKARTFGGRAASQQRNGFVFNRGIHALYPGGAASRVLTELDIRYSYGTPADVWVHQQGRFYPFPVTPATLLGSRLLALGDKWELARVFATLPRVDVHALAATSVSDWLDTVRRPLVRRFLARLAHPFMYTIALDLVSAEVVVQDLDAPRFMSTQSLFARLAPEGGAVVSLFKQLDPRLDTDPHADQAELEALLDAAQPGWRATVVARQFLPRIEAVGALPLARRGGFAGRPGHVVPGIANCHLAGDWVGPEGFLVDASLASARTVAQRLITKRPTAAFLAAA